VVVENNLDIWDFGLLRDPLDRTSEVSEANSGYRNPKVSCFTSTFRPSFFVNDLGECSLSNVLMKIFGRGISHEGLIPFGEPLPSLPIKVLEHP
jgi:hypothetical protein